MFEIFEIHMLQTYEISDIITATENPKDINIKAHRVLQVHRKK